MFCLVGAASTLVATAVFSGLIYGIRLDRWLQASLALWPAVRDFVARFGLHIQVAALAASLCGMTNSFYWNSRWTFRRTEAAGRTARYVKFAAVNAVGITLNQVIVFAVNGALLALHGGSRAGWEPMAAFITATGIVVFWNFLANKYWTFSSPA